MQSSGSAGCTVQVPRLLDSRSHGLALALQIPVLYRSLETNRSGSSEVPIPWWQLGRALLHHNSRNISFNPTKLLPQGIFLLVMLYFCSKIAVFCHMYIRQELCFTLSHSNLKANFTNIRDLSDLKQATIFLPFLSLLASFPFQANDHSPYLYPLSS